MSSATGSRHRPLTGVAVLLYCLAFFGVVFAVNGVMVWAASSTFRGLETDSSYKAGLQFGRDIVAAHAQAARHWQVSGRIVRNAAGDAVLEVTARDSNGAPLTGLTADARLAHPADARRDHDIPIEPVAAGLFRGSVRAPLGQWELVVDLYRGNDRMFRSKSRVIMK